MSRSSEHAHATSPDRAGTSAAGTDRNRRGQAVTNPHSVAFRTDPAQPLHYGSKEPQAMHNHQEQTPPAFSQPYVIDLEAEEAWVRQEYGISEAETPPSLTPEQVLRLLEIFAEIAELEQVIRDHNLRRSQRICRESGFPSHPSSPDDFGPSRAS